MSLTILTHTGPHAGTRAPTAARPLRPLARDLDADELLATHRHAWGQVTYAKSGVVRVTVADSSWIVPPQRAIWIAPEVEHEIVVLEKAQLRPLGVFAARAPFAGDECKVLAVSPLLSAAILALGELDDSETRREMLLAELILDELARSATTPIRVPLPHDKRLQALCKAMIAEPGSSQTLADWAHVAGASARTLARLFERDLGMSFGQWRQQVRLAHAAPLIARGEPLARVADQLGYASQSAFSAMFKKTFGVPPTSFFAHGA